MYGRENSNRYNINNNAIGVCGCMSNNNDSKKDVVQQEGSLKT